MDTTALLTPEIVNKLITPDPQTTELKPHTELLTEGTGTLSGSGVLDEVMKAIDEHLHKEWGAGRITGSTYSTTYLQCMSTAMQVAAQYAAGSSAAYWQAKQAEANYRKAEADILKALADIDIARLQIKIAEKELELKEKEIAQKDEQIKTERFNSWRALQSVLTEQANTQDLIGTINPNNIEDPTTIFTPTAEIKGKEGSTIDFQIKQTKELERTSIRSLADHYKDTFSTNQTSLNDLKPYAFGYNGSRVKTVENFLLAQYGLDGPQIDKEHPEDKESDREEED